MLMFGRYLLQQEMDTQEVPISAVIGFLGHRSNWETALSGDWFSTRTRQTGNSTFQSPLFCVPLLISYVNSMGSSHNHGYKKGMKSLLTWYHQYYQFW